jgi:hypothetical protein
MMSDNDSYLASGPPAVICTPAKLKAKVMGTPSSATRTALQSS